MRRTNYLVFHAIKESFDRLPTAVCFFDHAGGIVLCNRQMYRLSQYLLNSNMQYLGEVEQALSNPPAGVVPLSTAEDTYRFPDNAVWRFERAAVTDRYGETYLQLTAADVTKLHQRLLQLADDNRRLAQDAEKLRRLSENVEAVAREKEQLAAKSAMHDSLAACITVTKQFLAGDLDGVDAAVILQEWEKSIAFRDAVLLPAKEKLLDSARSSGVTVRFNGGQPTGRSAELVYIAMQVCLNNAIQYAQATELTASLWNIGDCCNVVIHNNGKAPEGPITEGGGLTNLRRRVERVGGTMTVQSIPEFALVLRIPNYGIAGGNEWL